MENKTVVFALTSSVELANEIVGELGIPWVSVMLSTAPTGKSW